MFTECLLPARNQAGNSDKQSTHVPEFRELIVKDVARAKNS